MKKTLFAVFCCSCVFLVYSGSFIWYTRKTVARGLELYGSVNKAESSLPRCNHCVLQKKGKNQVSPVRDMLSGKTCLQSARMYGVIPAHTRYLTIGVPSVDRKRGRYLYKTLKSLVVNLDEDERDNVTIVVLVADADASLRAKRANETRFLFHRELKTGLILIIEPLFDFYPTVKITRRTFNDSLERIQWRSKQVLDFAFLLNCAQGLAEYFLILEDDVEASPGYTRAIRDFVLAKKGQDWVSLTFSGFFIIGRLFRNDELSRLRNFLVMFHLEKPVDLLILQFMDLLVPDRFAVTRRIPSLFQHTGLFSSLGGKIQKVKDRSFVPAGYTDNPPADIVTTLGVYKKHFPELCYASSPDKFFWGSAPKANDTVDVVLRSPIRLQKVTVVSGHPSHKNDFVKHAELKLSPTFKQMLTNRKADCHDFRTVDYFRTGNVDISFDASQNVIVQCIRIEFMKKQSNWILIRQITVRGQSI